MGAAGVAGAPFFLERGGGAGVIWSYDDKCEELARRFVADEELLDATEDEVRDLAQTIQDALEDWLRVRAHYRGEDPRPRGEAGMSDDEVG